MLSSSLPAQHVQCDYERMLVLPQTVYQASAMHSKYGDDFILVYCRGWGKETPPPSLLPWKSSSRCGSRCKSGDLEKMSLVLLSQSLDNGPQVGWKEAIS